MAPLLAGGVFVIYASYFQLGLPDLWQEFQSGEVEVFLRGFADLQERADFWLWFYLIFAVSSTMMPSASDRRAWLPIALFILIIIAVVLLLGAGPLLVGLWEQVANPARLGLEGLTIAFGISSAVHLVLLPPLWAVRRSLTRLTGLQIA